MKATRLLGITMAVLASATACAQKDLRAAIERQNAQQIAMFKKRDVNGSIAMMAPGYTTIAKNGMTLSRDDSITQMKEVFKRIIKINKLNIKLISYKPVKGGLEVVSDNDMDVSLKGNDGKPMHVRYLARSKELWVKHGKGFLIQKSEELSNKTWLNGKLTG